MKHSLLFLLSGPVVLFTGFLLKVISYYNVFGRVPLYMGPPVDPSVLHVMETWQYPWVLDTAALITFCAGIGLVVLGIVIVYMGKIRLSSNISEKEAQFFSEKPL